LPRDSRAMRASLTRIGLYIAAAIALWLAASVIYDALLPVISSPRCPSSRVVVIDVSGVLNGSSIGAPVVHGLTLPQFLSLGKCRAKYVVIVSHGLRIVSSITTKRGGFALELSEPASAVSLIKYPLFIFTEAVMRGYVRGYTAPRLAVTSRAIEFMDPLRGKIVILITCPLGDIKDFARALVSRGCTAVAYPSTWILLSRVSKIVRSVVGILEKSENASAAIEELQRLGFVVVTGSEGR